MRNRTVWLLATGLVVAAPPWAVGQDVLEAFSSASPGLSAASAVAAPSARPTLAGSDEGQVRDVDGAPPRPEERPPGLLALYAGFATLQVLDAHSTLQAVQSGYEESNPLVAPFTQSPAAMYAFKAATTTATILLVEKLSRKHRGAAIGLMIAVNVAYAGVVAHNYRQSSR
jgi:hypothetical protein